MDSNKRRWQPFLRRSKSGVREIGIQITEGERLLIRVRGVRGIGIPMEMTNNGVNSLIAESLSIGKRLLQKKYKSLNIRKTLKGLATKALNDYKRVADARFQFRTFTLSIARSRS